MDYVNWDIFTWAMGLIIIIISLLINYIINQKKDQDSKMEELNKDFDNKTKELNVKMTEINNQLGKTNACALEMQLAIVSIRGDIKSIDSKQADIKVAQEEMARDIKTIMSK